MADVEQHYGQKEGRVNGAVAAVAVAKQQQIMTPCPSPDEAMFVGEDRAEDLQKARLSTVNGDAEPTDIVVVAPSTNIDTDHGTATDVAASRRESAVSAVAPSPAGGGGNGINTMATSPAESAHSSTLVDDDAMVVTADDTSAPIIPSDQKDEQLRKSSPDSIMKGHEDENDQVRLVFGEFEIS
ncbi:hypothetical protein TWF788_004011 [Orbilia oligospora]|uniref:Uncharacterized protein n=1 Tax=Orbilia oligospora TaxID=2813651 RepID=A0A7C8PH71_ORBOL|nr:hypothetical protein TWF788_004011 [Orbilia oligospora]